MRRIVIPQIEFRQAHIMDVLDFLTEASRTGDHDQIGVNFVPLNLGTGNARSEDIVPTITLNLRRVRLFDAVRYVTEVAGLRFRAEDNAVVVYRATAEEDQASAP